MITMDMEIVKTVEERYRELFELRCFVVWDLPTLDVDEEYELFPKDISNDFFNKVDYLRAFNKDTKVSFEFTNNVRLKPFGSLNNAKKFLNNISYFCDGNALMWNDGLFYDVDGITEYDTFSVRLFGYKTKQRESKSKKVGTVYEDYETLFGNAK